MPQPCFDRFLTALRCQQPDRVPLAELKVEDEVKSAFLGRPMGNPQTEPERYFQNEVDFAVQAGYDYIRAPIRLPFPETAHGHQEEYGVYGGQKTRAWAESHQALVNTAGDLDRVAIPTAEQADFSALELLARLMPPGMEMVVSIKGGGIFERTWMLMGFENFSLALADQPPLVYQLVERIGLTMSEVYRRALDFPRVRGVWYGDDIAYTEGLMISPRFYREHTFPWVRRIGDACRAKGYPMIYHSDGVLWEVIPDLIGCGAWALHPIEPKAMDIAEVKRRYAGRLCLIGNIDLAYTLTRGTPAEVQAEVRTRLREIAPGGGYCLGSSNSVPEYVPLDNYRAMIEAGLKYGRYPISPEV